MYSISYLTHDICMASYAERERKKERQKPDDLGNVQLYSTMGEQMMKKKGGELPSGTRTGFAEGMMRCDALRASEMND